MLDGDDGHEKEDESVLLRDEHDLHVWDDGVDPGMLVLVHDFKCRIFYFLQNKNCLNDETW